MLVIDASVAIKFVVAEEGFPEALRLFERDQLLIAPDWMMMEASHGIWRKWKDKEIDRERALRALDSLPEYFSGFFPAHDLMDAAIELAFAFDHAPYDCIYLVLAEQKGAQLITADRKFWNAAKRAGRGERVELLTWAGQKQ